MTVHGRFDFRLSMQSSVVKQAGGIVQKLGDRQEGHRRYSDSIRENVLNILGVYLMSLRDCGSRPTNQLVVTVEYIVQE